MKVHGLVMFWTEDKNMKVSLWEIQPTSAHTDMDIYCITNSLASYLFQQPIVAIFSGVFYEGYIYRECQYNLIYKDKMLCFKYSFQI